MLSNLDVLMMTLLWTREAWVLRLMQMLSLLILHSLLIKVQTIGRLSALGMEAENHN